MLTLRTVVKLCIKSLSVRIYYLHIMVHKIYLLCMKTDRKLKYVYVYKN